MKDNTRSLVSPTRAASMPEKVPSSSLIEQIVGLLETILEPERQQKQEVVATRQRRRGRPLKLSWAHLWLVILKGTLGQATYLTTMWRCLCLETTGSFLPLHVTYEALRKRLVTAGTSRLQELFEQVSAALSIWSQRVHPNALTIASFATQIVALDESTLDALRRLTEELRDLAAGDPHLLVGKIAGLFDLRQQRWLRVQFRADVLAGCSVGVLLLLEGLPAGSLILADLGYFSFPWFDYLSEQGYFWISRLKEKVTYEIVEVLAYDDHTGMLDAIVWLGKYRADQAGRAVRLIIFSVGDRQYRYLTNVLDPNQLSLLEITQLYARRWDIELAFKLLKCELGLHIWWGAKPELVLIQLWIALILAQVLHALQLHIALQAEVEPFDVSLHLLVELLAILPSGPTPIIDRLIEEGRFLGLIRPSRRTHVQVPNEHVHRVPASQDPSTRRRKARYAQRNPHPRTAPFFSLFQTQLLI